MQRAVENNCQSNSRLRGRFELVCREGGAARDFLGLGSKMYQARYTKVPTCYGSFLAEGETNFLFNPCSSACPTCSVKSLLPLFNRDEISFEFISSGCPNYFANTELIIYYEDNSFFWTLSGVLKPFRIIGFRCRVSGFRPALTFLLLTPETRHLKPECQCPII